MEIIVTIVIGYIYLMIAGYVVEYVAMNEINIFSDPKLYNDKQKEEYLKRKHEEYRPLVIFWGVLGYIVYLVADI